jgi:hypothetical protein
VLPKQAQGLFILGGKTSIHKNKKHVHCIINVCVGRAGWWNTKEELKEGIIQPKKILSRDGSSA